MNRPLAVIFKVGTFVGLGVLLAAVVLSFIVFWVGLPYATYNKDNGMSVAASKASPAVHRHDQRRAVLTVLQVLERLLLQDVFGAFRRDTQTCTTAGSSAAGRTSTTS